MKLLPKQENAVYYLKDNTTKELLFGGAAGGAKTSLGCLWLIEMCQKYPGTRWLMGRSKLKTLKETTLNTFFELTSEPTEESIKLKQIRLGIQNQFVYKEQRSLIKWNNGSEIILKDLFFYPSDPNFNELGSLEITGAFIDECDQIVRKAWQIVKSRIRYKLTEYNLTPKILGTCNPSHTWLYLDFYKPHQAGKLPKQKKFIQSLPTDNPFLPDTYLESLLELDQTTKERLYFGNWDYIDDPSALCEYPAILDMFTNDHIRPGQRYISADLAMQGRDRFVGGYWEGMICNVSIDMAKSTPKDIENKLNELKIHNGVGNSQIVADSDGLGQYISGYINNIREFHGGARASNRKEYANKKAECAWMLAALINKREIKVVCSADQQESIIKELSICLKRDNTYNDIQKKKLISKDEMKKLLGHSPDYLDMLLMRMYFEVSQPIFAG